MSAARPVTQDDYALERQIASKGGTMSHVKVLSQSDAAHNAGDRWMQHVTAAKKLLVQLENELRQMDVEARLLKGDHDIVVEADLGPMGNAAAATRRDLVESGATRFAMPA